MARSTTEDPDDATAPSDSQPTVPRRRNKLSLTGYEPALARRLAMTVDDARLEPLRKLVQEESIVIVVGAPVFLPGTGLHIAAFVLSPGGSVSVYTKQFLHPGEEQVFVPGSGGPLIQVAGSAVALAICADTSHPEHAQCAAAGGASLYAASVLVSEQGYAGDTQRLQDYARRHSMSVLMANHGTPTGGWPAAGRSAMWAAGGSLIVAANTSGERLVCATQRADGWHGHMVAIR